VERREFLSATLGLAGLTASGSALGQLRPCSPGLLTVSGGTRAVSSCLDSGPEWFRELEPQRWMEIGGGASFGENWQNGSPLVDVLHTKDHWSPAFETRTGLPLGYGNYPNAVFASWNGATVDQRRGELLIAGNGGHANGPDNGAYALTLRSETPGWRRIADATPGSHLVGVTHLDQYTQPAVYLDGRPAAMHTCGVPAWANDRVWFPFQNSYFVSGKSSFATFSFDRALLDTVPGKRFWSEDSPLPWRYHGQVPEKAAIGNFTFGSGVYDRRNQRVYYFGKSGSSYWYLDVDPSSPGFELISWIKPRGFSYSCAWAVSVHALDRNLIVLGSTRSQDILVLDADRPDDISSWEVKGTTPDFVWDLHSDSSPNGYALEYGAVYHASSQSILLFNPNRMEPGKLRQLTIPRKADGSYDRAGSWIWSEVQMKAAGGKFPAPLTRGSAAAGGVYGRFNIVEDLDGKGTPALVAATQVQGPTYVCKLGEQLG
jgi:hypothetical protein